MPLRARRTAVAARAEAASGLSAFARMKCGMNAPSGAWRAASVGKCAAAWQVSNATAIVAARSAKRAIPRRRGFASAQAVSAARGSIARNRGVGATALTTPHFLLLYAAMLVAAAGNTALQSVMPAIGREIGIADFWVAIAYTWSAVLWVAARALLGGEERPPRPQGADRDGRRRLHRLDDSCAALALFAGLSGWIGGALTFGLFAIFRAIYGGFGCATPIGDPGLSRLQDPAQRRGSRRCRHCPPRSASARSSARRSRRLFVLPFVGLPGPCSPSR